MTSLLSISQLTLIALASFSVNTASATSAVTEEHRSLVTGEFCGRSSERHGMVFVHRYVVSESSFTTQSMEIGAFGDGKWKGKGTQPVSFHYGRYSNTGERYVLAINSAERESIGMGVSSPLNRRNINMFYMTAANGSLTPIDCDTVYP